MSYQRGIDRKQLHLFPEASPSATAPSKLVGEIDAFVESLDLESLGFQLARINTTGRPGYDPRDLLKAHLFAALRHGASCRDLAREARRDRRLVWLLRGLAPSFKTLADFRQQNSLALNQAARRFLAARPSLGGSRRSARLPVV